MFFKNCIMSRKLGFGVPDWAKFESLVSCSRMHCGFFFLGSPYSVTKQSTIYAALKNLMVVLFQLSQKVLQVFRDRTVYRIVIW